MAFATLEDLQGSADLILFPRVWEEVRAQVAVDQIVVVRGKVQIEEGKDGATILADSVETNVQLAQASGAGEWAAEGGAGGSPPSADPEPVAAGAGKRVPEMAASEAGRDATPPPPPNWEDDEDRAPAPRRKASMDVGSAQAVETPQNGERDPSTDSEDEAAGAIVVEIDPAVEWQSVFRQVLSRAEEYEGHDVLALSLSGANMTMEFPERPTHYCPELVASLEDLPGIVRVARE